MTGYDTSHIKLAVFIAFQAHRHVLLYTVEAESIVIKTQSVAQF